MSLPLLFFIFFSFCGSLTLLILGINKRNTIYLFTSLSFFIPLALLMNSGFDKEINVYLSEYILIAPICYLNIYLGLSALQTSRILKLGILSFLGIFNLFNYFNSFRSDVELKAAQAKEEHLVKAPGVANLFFAHKHPYIEEVTQFYGRKHLGYDTFIIPSPMHQRDIAIIAHVVDKYNGINYVISDEAHEKDSEPVVMDIIKNKFKVKDINFYPFDNTPHPYLQKGIRNFKVVFFIRKENK